ncbi:hypothetical protein [Cribrihabitans neustonicus]|uniref:hypothetical protein n=1 Tax=Cribrihabitans neustonicus TaxID=1429085 RepID=UPI003B5A92A7
MPGLREDLAAETILGNLRGSLMQDAAYQWFRSRYEAQLKATVLHKGDALRLFDQETKQFEQNRANLLRAVKNGLHSDAVINEFNAVDAKLEPRSDEREALVPTPIELPTDLPALYRDFVTNITSTLSDEGVAGRASDELHALLDQVIIRWNAVTRSHEFEMRGGSSGTYRQGAGQNPGR